MYLSSAMLHSAGPLSSAFVHFFHYWSSCFWNLWKILHLLLSIRPCEKLFFDPDLVTDPEIHDLSYKGPLTKKSFLLFSLLLQEPQLGCPRNKQKKIRFEPKQTVTQSLLVCFAKPKNNFFFGLFRTRIETIETNESVSKQTKTKEKKQKAIR
jgi:hypothetical protein